MSWLSEPFLAVLRDFPLLWQLLIPLLFNRLSFDLRFWNQTWMTLIDSPVSCASFSLMCRVGFGVAANAALRISSCFALMVVLGPLLFPFASFSPSSSNVLSSSTSLTACSHSTSVLLGDSISGNASCFFCEKNANSNYSRSKVYTLYHIFT